MVQLHLAKSKAELTILHYRSPPPPPSPPPHPFPSFFFFLDWSVNSYSFFSRCVPHFTKCVLAEHVLIRFLSTGVQSDRFLSTIQDGDELFLCAGVSITLPWQYELSPGDVISDIQWLYNGLSDELIAMVGHGHFITLPAFAGGRVEQVTNGGIVVNKATVSDTGNYTVEVQGYDAAGDHFILRQTVVVQISGKFL